MITSKKEAEMEDVKINVKVKLSALWITLMFCYTYADILGFYAPGNIEELISGGIAGIQMTQGLLLGSAILIRIPMITTTVMSSSNVKPLSFLILFPWLLMLLALTLKLNRLRAPEALAGVQWQRDIATFPLWPSPAQARNRSHCGHNASMIWPP